MECPSSSNSTQERWYSGPASIRCDESRSTRGLSPALRPGWAAAFTTTILDALRSASAPRLGQTRGPSRRHTARTLYVGLACVFAGLFLAESSRAELPEVLSVNIIEVPWPDPKVPQRMPAVWAVNNDGLIGGSVGLGLSRVACLVSNGGLAEFGDGEGGRVLSINNSGGFAGYGTNPFGFFDRGAGIDLREYLACSGINDSGVVCGQHADAGLEEPDLWSKWFRIPTTGAVQYIGGTGPEPNWHSAVPRGIDNNGNVWGHELNPNAGNSLVRAGPDGTIARLGRFGNYSVFPSGVSGAGNVAMVANSFGGGFRPLALIDSRPVTFSAIGSTISYDVSDNGYVVGDQGGVAVAWFDGARTTLNALAAGKVPGGYQLGGYGIYGGAAISDNGRCIAVVARQPSTNTRAFALLTIRPGTGKARGRVTDAETGEPLPAATISVVSGPIKDPSAEAGADGQFEIDDLPDGDYDLRIADAANQYHAREASVHIEKKSTQWLTVQLRPKHHRPEVVEVFGQYCNPQKKGYYYYGAFASDAFTGPMIEKFIAQVDWGPGNPPGEVAFTSPTGTVAGAPINGDLTQFEAAYNMERDFSPNQTLTVRAIPQPGHGEPSQPYEVNFKVIEMPPGTERYDFLFQRVKLANTLTYKTRKFSLKLKAGEVPAEIVPFSIPVVGGLESKVGFSADLSGTLRGDGTADAVANFGTENSVSPDASGLGPTKLGGVAFNVSVGGGPAYRFVEAPSAEWTTGGTVRGAIGFSASFPAKPVQQGIFIGPVPVPYFWQAKGDIGMVFQVTLTGCDDDSNLRATGVINFDPLVRLTLTGAIGFVDLANVYIQGALGIKMKIEPSLAPALRKEEIFGTTSVGYQVGPYKFERPLVDVSWSLINAAQTVPADDARTRATVIDRSIIRAAGGPNVFVGGAAGPRAGSSESPVQLNVFNESSPSVVALGSDRLMVWQQDDLSRTPVNRTALVWSYFDGATQTWSAPAIVDDDGTADLRPRLAELPGGDVLCIWQDVKEVLAEPADPNDPAQVEASYAEFKSKSEIAAARFDATTRSWSARQRLTDDLSMDHSPKICAGADGTAMAAWVRNPSGHETGSAGQPSSVVAAEYSGTQWLAPIVIATPSMPILRSEIAHSQAGSVVVFSADTDDDLLTQDDRELFTVQRSGGTWFAPLRATTDAVADASPLAYWSAARGEFGFIWKRGNDIVDAFGTPASPRTAVALPHAAAGVESLSLVIGDASTPRVGVIWQEQAGAGPDLQAALLDSDTAAWSAPLPLTADAAVETMPAGAFGPSGELIAAYNKTQRGTEVRTIMVDGVAEHVDFPTFLGTDLYTTTLPRRLDLSVSAPDITFDPPNPLPGELSEARVRVRNTGNVSATNVLVIVRQKTAETSDSFVLASARVDIPAGGDATVTGTVSTVRSESARSILAEIDPANALQEPDRTNNIAEVPIAAGDLTVLSTSSEQVGPSDWQLVCRTYNNGGITSPATTVDLHDGDATGPMIATLAIPPLAPGAFFDAPWLWQGVGSLRGTGPRDVTAVLDPLNTFPEFNEDDNALATQLLPNSTPPPPPCPTDINGDRLTNTLDLVLLLQRFGQNTPPGSPGAGADLNSDGAVNTLDLILLLQRFGQPCP